MHCRGTQRTTMHTMPTWTRTGRGQTGTRAEASTGVQRRRPGPNTHHPETPSSRTTHTNAAQAVVVVVHWIAARQAHACNAKKTRRLSRCDPGRTHGTHAAQKAQRERGCQKTPVTSHERCTGGGGRSALDSSGPSACLQYKEKQGGGAVNERSEEHPLPRDAQNPTTSATTATERPPPCWRWCALPYVGRHVTQTAASAKEPSATQIVDARQQPGTCVYML